MAIRIEESPNRGILPELEPVKSGSRQSMWLWHKLHGLLRREDSPNPSPSPKPMTNECGDGQQQATWRDSGRRVGVGLPRSATFKRQNSEKRDRLEPIQACLSERRAISAHRQQRAISASQPRSKSSPSPKIPSQVSAPSLSLSKGISDKLACTERLLTQTTSSDSPSPNNGTTNNSLSPYRSPSQSSSERFDELARDEKHQIDVELDTKWILNLSMHFRDKSDREKFFVTFAEEPNRWRRVTISCDYRSAEPDSLEMDLKELQYQRDKNAQIYESIRDSLPSIQFYNTVTNLKLETENGRLHVHVTEDVNEIIPYPPRLSVQHITADAFHPIREARESQINFLSHLSGFVYKVDFEGGEYIKKEIPGPDTVDEFLYEVNALHALSASTSVIKLEAIVFDDTLETVKGLLISYAERGALVDLLYDHKGDIPWTDRMRWARQAIQGLSEIHEEGYVQGDFTLSNIVINSDNDAKIIDINRRGCPVGWEPPEIESKIASNQRISMYIGQKSDLYQLGMTLWALAMDEDEPERHDRPLSVLRLPDEVPNWFKVIVKACLSPQPRDRPSAKELLRQFPPLPSNHSPSRISTTHGAVDERLPKRYIDPVVTVEREDLERLGRRRRRSTSQRRSNEDTSFIDPPSSSYQVGSGSSFVSFKRWGRRSPPSETADDRDSGHMRSNEEGIGVGDHGDLPPRIISISPGREPRYNETDFDADVEQKHRSSLSSKQSTPLEALEHHSPEPSPPFDDPITQIAPATFLGHDSPARHQPPEAEALDTELELPSPHQVVANAAITSIISDSTPLDTTAKIVTSTALPPQLDLATADLVGFGGHPTLDEYSPHEPMKVPDTQSSHYYDSQIQQQHSSASPDISMPADDVQSSNRVETPSETTPAATPDLASVPQPE